MSDLRQLQERFRGISLSHNGSLNKYRRKSRKSSSNPSDEQLAIQQSIDSVQLSDEEAHFIEKGINAFAEVAGYYQKRLPIEAISNKQIVELYMKYSDKPRHEAVVQVVRDYIRQMVAEGLLESTLATDHSRCSAAISMVMTKRLREAKKL